ncbi:MAG: 2-oxoglutarate-dependent dioxygenase [Rhodanobacter sp.]|nr:MAG: 2-oxoglutarate-dependent dioxygenase [Rhodanobacter sp.]TAM08794.1 MAG: 2-oxoglutarate-dependent dioxygenase [Rhodanobacter sp.]TAM36836.1 MAG: 2-oxoglutarate-dependent dioxygenase [Rhodanobacter sp.]
MPTLSPSLRDWILATHRAGHDLDAIMALLETHGYDATAYRNAVAQLVRVELAPPATGARRTRHPTTPEVQLGERTVAVTASLDRPLVRVLDGLLTHAECDELIALARPRLARALTVDAQGGQQVDRRRTNAGMFFKPGEFPLVARIEQRIAELVDLPASHGEGLQVLHYESGQEYQPHYDWFDPAQAGYDAITARGGQRIATIVMYLNTPEAGGGTAFPKAGLTVTARRGTAVYFAYTGGDESSLHAGLPVARGEKWIATKWLRERPY